MVKLVKRATVVTFRDGTVDSLIFTSPLLREFHEAP